MNIGNLHVGFVNPKSITVREVVLNPAYMVFAKFEPVSQIFELIFGGFANLKIYANQPDGIISEANVARFFKKNVEKIYLKKLLEGIVYLAVAPDRSLFISEKETKFKITDALFEEYGVIPMNMLKSAVAHHESTIKVDKSVIEQNGIAGIVSPKTSTNENYITLPEDAEQLECDFNSNGLMENQRKYLFSSKPFEFSEPNNILATLNFTEKQLHTFLVLCDKLGCPKELFAVSSESTYENRQLAMVDLYRRAVLPFANKVIEAINDMYKEVTGVADNFYVAENEITEIATLNKTQTYAARASSEGLIKLYEAGLMTYEEVRNNLDDIWILNNQKK